MSSEKANDYQVAGNHYKNVANLQHWDVCIRLGMGYLEGVSTKYVCRWRKKGGIEDLRKALHYLNKLEEDGFPQRILLPVELAIQEIAVCAEAYNLTPIERAYFEGLATWKTKEDLEQARELLFFLMEEAEAINPSPSKLTEENHHAPRVGSNED